MRAAVCQIARGLAAPSSACAPLSTRSLGVLAACAPAPRRASTPLSTRAFSAVAEEDVDVDGVAYGFMASQALFTGLECGVFDAIAAASEDGLTLPEIQKATSNTAPRLQTAFALLSVVWYSAMLISWTRVEHDLAFRCKFYD